MTRLVATSFADALIARDLPALDADRREQVVAFIGRRLGGLSGPMAFGVAAVATSVAATSRLVGAARTAHWLADRPLPLVGEYVRLLRSLSFAYVWETWPTTAADGGTP